MQKHDESTRWKSIPLRSMCTFNAKVAVDVCLMPSQHRRLVVGVCFWDGWVWQGCFLVSDIQLDNIHIPKTCFCLTFLFRMYVLYMHR